jgi:phospho-N-acetylmuramoyl-pentapeptide-transferase
MVKFGESTTLYMLIVALSAMIISALVVWRLIPFLRKIKVSQTILEDAPERHMQKSGTPTMGGIGIITGIVFGAAVAGILAGFSADLAVCVVVTIAFGITGFVDDYTKVAKKRNLGLTAKQKLAVQLIISLLIALYYVFIAGHGTEIVIPFLFKRVDIGYFIIPYFMFIIVALVNAVNLTDGLDGLAGGVSAVSSLFWPVFAAFTALAIGIADPELVSDESLRSIISVSMLFMAIAGACLGFLLFNRHPAKIFMGDTGSLALGGGMAAAAILTHTELFIPIAGFVFVAEAFSDVIQVASYKLRHGKRVFKMAPLHHHFELSGWPERKVVIVFSGVTVILCAACVLISRIVMSAYFA